MNTSKREQTKLKSGNIHLNTIISTHTLENAGCIYPRTHGRYGYSSNIYKYRKQGKKKNKEKTIHKQRRAFHRSTYKDILLIYSHLQNKAQERKNHVLGNCWLKLPALAKHNDNHLPGMPTNRRSWERPRCCLWKLTGRFRKGLRGGKRWYVLPTSQNPSHWNPSWQGGVVCLQEGPWVRKVGQRQPAN